MTSSLLQAELSVWMLYVGVMRMRDKIAHHYFEVDPEVVYVTIKENIPPMIPVIAQMINDIQ